MSDTYTIGRGKPPVATRFRKGQSGNPSGKAVTVRSRLRQSVERAFSRSFDQTIGSSPASVLDRAVHALALAATRGDTAALRLLVKLAEDDGQSERDEDDDAAFSLLQGKKQGNGKNPAPRHQKTSADQGVDSNANKAAGKIAADTARAQELRATLDSQLPGRFLALLDTGELERLAAIGERMDKAGDDQAAFATASAAFDAFLQTLHADQIDAYLTATGAIPPP
jgi:hypothetical protein